MNSSFIATIAVFLVLSVNASHNDHHNNDDLIQVTELYDAVIDLITYKEDGDYNCETRLNNLKELLDDSFSHCYPGFDQCMDKDQFINGASVHCNEYKEVEDFIEITQSSDSCDTISLSVTLVHFQMDDCQMTKTYDEVITYNEAGLITTINVQSEAKESLACPDQEPETTNKYAEEPADDSYGEAEEEELPPVAEDDYVTTDVNVAVMIDVLYNDYDPDRAGVSGKQALVISDYTQGNKGKVEQKNDKLRYRPNNDQCGTDTFTYWVADLDDGLTASANVYVDIACPPEYDEQTQYTEQPVTSSYGQGSDELALEAHDSYGEEEEEELPPVAEDDYVTTDVNVAVMIDVLYNDYDPDRPDVSGKQALVIEDYTQGNKGKVEQKSDKLRYRPNNDQCGTDTFTYWVADLDDGLTASANVYIDIACPEYDENGDQYVSEPVNEYESELAPEAHDDSFMVQQDEVTRLYVLANDKDPNNPELSGRDALDIISTTDGNQGEVFISPTGKRLRYVPNDGQCGDDSFEYSVVNEYGLSDTAKVSITINCDTYSEEQGSEPETGYESHDDEKNEIIHELNTKMSDIACKSKSDTADDIDIEDKFCLNMEYEAICNDDEICGMYAGKYEGRAFLLGIIKQYQDMFDDATVTLEDDTFSTKYRKGSCAGHYVLRVNIEYDEENQCISKWTDYYDDLIISDSDCDNSEDKWITKIQTQCKYDDEIDNGYGNTDAPVLVKMEREDKLKSFYGAAFDCRLKKNQGNTQALDTFMGYLSDTSKLCVVKDSGNDETCYGKDEIRSMMADRYVDENESIDYNVDITYNDGNKIESKCTSRRKRSDGCVVVKEEYDTCLFNDDGSIKEFKVNRSNRRTECEKE